ncbi:hypothetical protein ACOSQ3_017407 [Xanthoceras sorbifolium]
MKEAFTFNAQPELLVTEEEIGKTSVGCASSKRARACDDVGNPLERESPGVSFKSKLLGMSNPSSWAGFNEQRKAILVCDEDTVITEGQFGPSMTIAPELKAQLCKPWEKEAKVNNESNVEIIPNSENLYGPWLYTSFNRGGFRPVNRNQDVTGNATNVGMSAAKSRGVKNQKTNDKDSVLSKDGQYQRRNEVNDVNGNGLAYVKQRNSG